MARKKTKKQKKQSELRTHQVKVTVSDSGLPVITSTKKAEISKNNATHLEQTQVSLLYRDLLKTLTVTLVVFFVLLFIFLYMR